MDKKAFTVVSVWLLLAVYARAEALPDFSPSLERVSEYIADEVVRENDFDIRITSPSTPAPDHLSFLSLRTGMVIPVGRVGIGEGRIVRLPALEVGAVSGHDFDERWGIKGELTVQSMPLQIEQNFVRTHIANQIGLNLVVSPYLNIPLCRRLMLTGSFGVGYCHYFGLKSLAKAITSTSGTIVGRVDFGTTYSFTNNFSVTASVGYECSRYRYSITPSAAYNVDRASSTSGLSSELLFTLISRLSF